MFTRKNWGNILVDRYSHHQPTNCYLMHHLMLWWFYNHMDLTLVGNWLRIWTQSAVISKEEDFLKKIFNEIYFCSVIFSCSCISFHCNSFLRTLWNIKWTEFLVFGSQGRVWILFWQINDSRSVKWLNAFRLLINS